MIEKPPENEREKAADGRRNNGRPSGTITTEPSTLVARLRAKTGKTQYEIAVAIDAREKTVWRYENGSIIPIKGPKREALEALAREHGISIEEPA